MTQEKGKNDYNTSINNFHSNKNKEITADLKCSLFLLKDIYEKYYGKSFKDNPNFEVKFTTKNKGTYLRIDPENYDLDGMTPSFYVMTPITDVFYLYQKAGEENYALFEENIREYLGGATGVNKKIIATLKDNTERKNFFYYNNGITIICNSVKPDSGHSKNIIKVIKPQIVNGCQTVNSIFEVLKEHIEKDGEGSMKEIFQSTYIMTKIIVVKDDKENNFYRNIVKYTNSQNAINEKVFGSVNEPFYKIQEKLKEKGILLLVKQSDKYILKNKEYKDKEEKKKLIKQANKFLIDFKDDYNYEFKKLQDCQINLDLLLQLIGAFEKDYQFAYIKKQKLLTPTDNIYNEFSSKINDNYTTNELITIILLYKKIEFDRKNNETKRYPVPYIVLNFLKIYIGKKELRDFKFNEVLFIYNHNLKLASEKYCKDHTYTDDTDYLKEKVSNKFTKMEFHKFVKHKVDEYKIKNYIEIEIKNCKNYNKDKYNKLFSLTK